MAAYRRAAVADSRLFQRTAPDYSQAMAVAIGFYLFGHLADLVTTLGFLSGGLPECNLIPSMVLGTVGVPGLIAMKVMGAVATAWVFWRLRARFFTVIFTSMLALLLIFVASVNSLDVIDALAMAGTL